MLWFGTAGDLRMRMFVLVALLASFLNSTHAAQPNATQPVPAQPISVARLQQELDAPVPPHSSMSDIPEARLQDATLSLEIEHLQLSERLTSPTLAGILAQHTFGPQTQRSLSLLADRSALLDPPAGELPKRPPPDAAQQQHILEAARAFVFQTLSHLPNFFATRTTSQFFGIPPELNKTGLPVHIGLHPRGTYSREITFRDGKELIDPMKTRSAPTLPQAGLESWGEFGPEPAVILMDVTSGTIAFHHWEQTPAGLAAVFRYSVAEPDSHYSVDYTCNGSNAFHAQPAYHGSLAIDPVSGAILRITLQADSKPDDPLSHVASVIEYGPVEIGGRSYICPLHSLAFSVEEVSVCFRDLKDQALVHNRTQVQPLILNRTTFSDYHHLASTHKILTDPPDNPSEPKK
jgi:hypothetical protein